MYNECRHIMPSGRKCHSPALSGKPYCYYHARLHQCTSRAGRPAKQLPLPQVEDARGIQLALAEALHALSSPFIETKRAGLLLYGLQIGSQLLKHTSAPRPDEIVRDLSDATGSPVDLDTPPESESATEILAPQKSICEPPHDCRNCPKQNSCCNYEEPDDEEEEEDVEESEENDDGEEEAEEEPEDDASANKRKIKYDPDYDPNEYLTDDEIDRRFLRALKRRRLEREARNAAQT